jgi:hypothetical protein
LLLFLSSGAFGVLILAGTEDHFIPFHQVADFQKAVVNAQRYDARVRPRLRRGRTLSGGLHRARSRSRFRLAPRQVLCIGVASVLAD